MNRRNFFKNLGIAVAAITVSKPILDALAAEGGIIHGMRVYSFDGITVYWRHLALFDEPQTSPSSIRKPTTSYKTYYIDADKDFRISNQPKIDEI